MLPLPPNTPIKFYTHDGASAIDAKMVDHAPDGDGFATVTYDVRGQHCTVSGVPYWSNDDEDGPFWRKLGDKQPGDD